MVNAEATNFLQENHEFACQKIQEQISLASMKHFELNKLIKLLWKALSWRCSSYDEGPSFQGGL